LRSRKAGIISSGSSTPIWCNPREPLGEQKRGDCHAFNTVVFSTVLYEVPEMTTKPKIVQLATFTPGEAERITGVTRATQRDWRRRELTSMSTRTGWTRFTTRDLAHLIVLHRLMPIIRPATAYSLARMSVLAPIAVLARDAYHDAAVRLAGEKKPLKGPESVDRYAVAARLGGESAQYQRLKTKVGSLLASGFTTTDYFTTTDLNSLPDRIREHGSHKQIPLSYYIVVDLFDVAEQMRKRRIKPYFIDANSTRAK
jgi:hypothetical protein